MMAVRTKWGQFCPVGLAVPPRGPAVNFYSLPLFTEFPLPKIPTIFPQCVKSHCGFKAFVFFESSLTCGRCG